MSRRGEKEFYPRMNRVMDKLALMHLSPNESKYCFVVLRKTFGFGKYEDLIRRDLMARLTGIDPTNVSTVKKRLEKRKIISGNASVIRFNLNTDQWEKVLIATPSKKVLIATLESVGRADKKGVATETLQSTNKLNKPKKVVSEVKMTRQEIDKLEGLEYIRAEMIYSKSFDIKFIDEVISKYEFMQLYDCWLALREAPNVRNPEGLFLAKLEKWVPDR